MKRNCFAALLLIGLLYAPTHYAQSQTREQRPTACQAQTTGGYIPPIPEEAALTKRLFDLTDATHKALNAHDYPAVESDAKKIKELDPRWTLADVTLADALFLEDKEADAMKLHEVLAVRGDVLPRTLLQYALFLIRAGRLPQAFDAYCTAEPGYTEQDAAQNAAGSEKPDDLLRKHVTFAPGLLDTAAFTVKLEAACRVGLGIQMRPNLGCPNDCSTVASAQYNRAHQLMPDSAIVCYYYGLSLIECRRYEEAQAAFTQALSDPDSQLRRAATDRCQQARRSILRLNMSNATGDSK